MKKTLYLKFMMGYVLFALFGFIVVSTFVQQTTEDRVRKERAEKLYSAASVVAESFALDLYKNETSLTSVKQEVDRMSKVLDVTMQIVNPSGTIIVDSRNPVDVENPIVIEGFDTTVMTGSYYTSGDFFGQFGEEMLSVSVPITSGYTIHGYVLMHMAKYKINAEVNALVGIDYLLFIVIFALSLIILIFFTEFVYIPLRKITVATEEYAAGNLHYELSVESGDEMGYLAASLSYMASEMAKGEDNQKRLVANVSHDFRSPLTSIKGYLEAMGDGTIPVEQHDKYIGVVLKETNRLITLTNSLLTLNNLNVSGMVLKRKDFDMNQLIYNTVSTFEGRCREKKISVRLKLTGEELFVNGDMVRIGQVINNLFDNAVKFSHKDSEITIETTEKKDKLFVSVKDQGIGIPSESIGHVFDRFYKSDLSRGKDKKGTGLGLSITKEIIRAHGENINVVSTEGVGTEFIFTLPVAKDREEEI
ncbi:MAG: HAMP domain-containing histidine kinase [Lachnospiraceae bacterium]|nr:HAMP domain-containing histidine kinase [Lachnospiraceae bacterium]